MVIDDSAINIVIVITIHSCRRHGNALTGGSVALAVGRAQHTTQASSFSATVAYAGSWPTFCVTVSYSNPAEL